MLEELCRTLNNWFVRDRYAGTFTVEDGRLSLPFLAAGQYYRIDGSLFSDGVHRYGDEEDLLPAETFTGTVWALAVPPAGLEIGRAHV